MSAAETFVVGALVIAACSYLVRLAWRRIAARGKGGCCGKCPVSRPAMEVR